MFRTKDLNTKEITLLILLAYSFSILVRMLWVSWADDIPSFYWDKQLMINTNDGYFFGAASEYLLNHAHASNPRVGIAINSYPGMVYMTYILAKYTPFSLDTVMLYMPAFISSLVVIPIILTGKLIKLPWVGFFAALLGSIAWSYYNRTMTGYYDTDMFSVFLQFTIFYFFLYTIYNKEDRNALWLALSLIIYPLFYPQGLSLVYAMFILWVGYLLLFQRQELNSYICIIVASIALWAVPVWIKIVMIGTLFIFLEQIKNKLELQKMLYLALIALFMFFVQGDMFALIWNKISGYTERGVEEKGLHFYQVVQTVREAGKISWETVANRIIGHPVLLIFSLIGYILLVTRHKAFIIALPLIGVGVFAHWAGLRFTVYAVPVAAFSLGYLFFIVSELIHNKKLSIVLFAFLSLVALYPNIDHIISYKVPTVFNNEEVKILNKLDETASDKDYTLAWWDYGYPIWYYSDTSTLIDGAKHDEDNFIISKILTTDDQVQAANLARLAVETYVDSNYSIVAKRLFKDKNPNDYLDQMKDSEFKLPPKTRDIYLYLPQRMLNIFPTVAIFSNLDLMTGKQGQQPFFYMTGRFKDDGKILYLNNGIALEKEKGVLHIGEGATPLKRFVVVGYDQQKKIHTKVDELDPKGQLSIIFMQSYGTFLIVDEKFYNSLFIQMFVFEKYDKDLFEPVIMSPYAKVYRLKR